MAKATKQPTDYTLTLELSRDEAEALLAAVGNIGGSITSSPRMHTNAIFYALKDAGVSDMGFATTGGHDRIVFAVYDK